MDNVNLYLHPASINEILQAPEVENAQIERIVTEYLCRNAATVFHGLNAPETITPSESSVSMVYEELEAADIDAREVPIDECECEIEAQKLFFKLAVEKYRQGVHAGKFKLEIGNAHTMADVLKIINAAKSKSDKARENSPWNKLRSSFKSLDKHKQAIESWLELLPKGSEYLSIICGSLKLILGIAVNLNSISEAVLDLLCEIPIILQNNRRLQKIHSGSARLHKLNIDLHVHILHALRCIFEYYEKSSPRRAVGAFMKQESYEAPLRATLLSIQKSRNELNEEVEICSQELLDDINRTGQENSSLLQTHVEESRNQNDWVRTESERVEKGRQEDWELHRRDRKRDQAEQRAIWQRFERKFFQFLRANPALRTQAASEFLKKDECQISEIKIQPKMASDQNLKRKRFKSHLDYDKQEIIGRMRDSLGVVHTLQQKDQDRATYTFESPTLRHWLGAAKRTILLIEGNAFDASPNMSSTSFVCAKMADTFQQIRKAQTDDDGVEVIAIHHFCSPRPSFERNESACALNSLIYQLVSQHKDFNFDAFSDLDDMDNSDVDTMARVFAQLVDQLGHSCMVFCLIDGLDWCDTSEQREDADRMLSRLLKLRRKLVRSKTGCSFKLLLTVTSNLRLPAAQAIAVEDILVVPDNVGRLGGYTDGQWNMGLGSKIENLFINN